LTVAALWATSRGCSYPGASLSRIGASRRCIGGAGIRAAARQDNEPRHRNAERDDDKTDERLHRAEMRELETEQAELGRQLAANVEVENLLRNVTS
jgi:hypothetical protein